MFDLRKIYVLNPGLNTGRPKQMSYVGEFTNWEFAVFNLMY